MEPVNARVVLEWSDGRKVEIGTVEMRSEEKGTKLSSTVRMNMKRFGWEIVRLGFRVMFPRRKWVTGYGRTEADT